MSVNAADPAPATARSAVPRLGKPWLLVALLALPAAVMVARLPVFPTSRWLNETFTLLDLPPRMHHHAEFVLFIPLSAIVVCFFRLTLGLPVLSLFRPILTAVGFQIVGIRLGLAFLLVVLAAVVAIKPLLKEAHYYVRVPLVLSLTAACLVVPLMMYAWWHVQTLRQVGYFPIISLALMCEAFTKILNDKGLRAAMWPTLNAIVAAIVITLLFGIPGVARLVLGCPEVLFLQGGVVLFIGRYLDLQLLAGRDPFLKGAPDATGARTPQTSHLRVVGNDG
jgi:7 transmembrane helices usually fused to an inactive transglutaminase